MAGLARAGFGKNLSLKKIAIIGAGWAGLAAAVAVSHAGQRAIVFEASRTMGGRARALQGTLPDGSEVTLDNGQHILIGAYTETLALMRQVGVLSLIHISEPTRPY